MDLVVSSALPPAWRSTVCSKPGTRAGSTPYRPAFNCSAKVLYPKSEHLRDDAGLTRAPRRLYNAGKAHARARCEAPRCNTSGLRACTPAATLRSGCHRIHILIQKPVLCEAPAVVMAALPKVSAFCAEPSRWTGFAVGRLEWPCRAGMKDAESQSQG